MRFRDLQLHEHAKRGCGRDRKCDEGKRVAWAADPERKHLAGRGLLDANRNEHLLRADPEGRLDDGGWYSDARVRDVHRLMRRNAAAMLVAAVCLVAGCSVQPATSGESVEEDLPPFPAEDRYVECLRERGWEAQRHLLSPPTVDTPKEQQSSFDADATECGETSGYTKAGTPDQWTEEQKKELYRLEVENHECLIAQGKPSDVPPSEDVFLETFGGNDVWYQAINAYLAGGTIDQAEYGELLLACPPPLMFNTIDGF